MHKVLVVDDSAFTRRMMRQHPEASGFDVVEAESGPEAIEPYGQHQPDVVTLDLVIPDMEAEEVLQRLKEFDAGARVVVCSCNVQTAKHQEVLDLGALAFLTKPVRAEDLLKVLAENPT